MSIKWLTSGEIVGTPVYDSLSAMRKVQRSRLAAAGWKCMVDFGHHAYGYLAPDGRKVGVQIYATAYTEAAMAEIDGKLKGWLAED
ncbi:MAG: hypothetical protein H7829_17155 [Magnetococcus sp. THC-1_WYH]